VLIGCLNGWFALYVETESEFNDFEPRLRSAKNRFQLSTGLNLKTLNTILSGTNHIWAVSQIKAAAQILYTLDISNYEFC